MGCARDDRSSCLMCRLHSWHWKLWPCLTICTMIARIEQPGGDDRCMVSVMCTQLKRTWIQTRPMLNDGLGSLAPMMYEGLQVSGPNLW